jgi:tRNA(fMet)-specific endonuclease VapC
MKLLLDTSAYVGFKLGHPQLVDYLSQSDTIYVSPIVIGELVFGFRNGSRFQENMEGLNRFLSHEVVEKITIGELTADRYSRIAAQLKQQGTPIPSKGRLSLQMISGLLHKPWNMALNLLPWTGILKRWQGLSTAFFRPISVTESP